MSKKPEYTLAKPELSSDGELFELETQKKRLSWLIQVGDKQVGVAWIDMQDSDYIESPSVYVAVDEAYRGRGIGSSVLKEMTKYAYCYLPYETIYSRNQIDDKATEKMYKKCGFENDEKTYMDDDGVQWQNVKLVL